MINDIRRDLKELQVPKWARRAPSVFRAWMLVAFILGWFVFRALLIIIYAIVIVPLSIVRRLFGSDSLRRELPPALATYWIPAEADKDKGRYAKKF